MQLQTDDQVVVIMLQYNRSGLSSITTWSDQPSTERERCEMMIMPFPRPAQILRAGRHKYTAVERRFVGLKGGNDCLRNEVIALHLPLSTIWCEVVTLCNEVSN